MQIDKITSDWLIASEKMLLTLIASKPFHLPLLSNVACCSRRELQSGGDLKVNSDKKPKRETREPQRVGNESTGIRVPRPRHISISKVTLLDSIISELFDSQDEIDQFRYLSKCLDSIILAEHKCILEDMRIHYDLNNSPETQKAGESRKENIDSPLKRVAEHASFQRAFVQLLANAEFEELSVRDLLLTSSLNTDYLLTLPINVDWTRASQSNAIIYRRGYATERQEGLLTGEKLDYLQSILLQRIFFLISRPLKKLGVWLDEIYQVIKTNNQIQDVEILIKNLKLWLTKLPFLQQSYSSIFFESNDLLEAGYEASSDLPIWLAAQRAVTRYEGILSTVGPRGRLLKRLLTWIGLAPSNPGLEPDLMADGDCKSHSRPIFLSRISVGDIWQPASLKYCEDNIWKSLRTAISILVSRSTLQEPAFSELILLYTKDASGSDGQVIAKIPPLQLKIYENIPIPDLPVIFPHKKLSFRILDTVRLDVATIFGLLAYFINYKFEDILSSPSAIRLDAIAVGALVIYISRVVLGYKQTWDRYQLLVNRTLYEKTLASGFGSVHFLLDASQQQQYKEAVLAYAILLKAENLQMASTRSIGEKCEKFVDDVFHEKIEMPIDKAKDTLLRLGLVTVGQEYQLQAVSCSRGAEILRQKWNKLLD